MKITVYSLAWDTDSGVGCEVYSTREARDAHFRECLLSHTDSRNRADFEAIKDIRELSGALEGELDHYGSRYWTGSHQIKVEP